MLIILAQLLAPRVLLDIMSEPPELPDIMHVLVENIRPVPDHRLVLFVLQEVIVHQLPQDAQHVQLEHILALELPRAVHVQEVLILVQEQVLALRVPLEVIRSVLRHPAQLVLLVLTVPQLVVVLVLLVH
jgi:hypothetical protein